MKTRAVIIVSKIAIHSSFNTSSFKDLLGHLHTPSVHSNIRVKFTNIEDYSSLNIKTDFFLLYLRQLHNKVRRYNILDNFRFKDCARVYIYLVQVTHENDSVKCLASIYCLKNALNLSFSNFLKIC